MNRRDLQETVTFVRQYAYKKWEYISTGFHLHEDDDATHLIPATSISLNLKVFFVNLRFSDLKRLSLEGILTPELGNLTQLRRLLFFLVTVV
ncbi:unnamed protein product [Lactuca virosa]|uniref:Uncharacterized protein n=1 Tax=Lactuca virosa TaxID=75947 RepID=A0AAU9N7I6_9ASTR|nr:unnamed protein product [Lactuca virosa]